MRNGFGMNRPEVCLPKIFSDFLIKGMLAQVLTSPASWPVSPRTVTGSIPFETINVAVGGFVYSMCKSSTTVVAVACN